MGSSAEGWKLGIEDDEFETSGSFEASGAIGDNESDNVSNNEPSRSDTNEPASPGLLGRSEESPVRPSDGESTGSSDLSWLVPVAGFLGGAVAQGVIGNRSDAAAVALARKLFGRVASRWRERRNEATDDALSPGEVSDLAKAAVLTLDWVTEPGRVRIVKFTQVADGGWRVVAKYGRFELSVLVPSGDPSEAKVLIIPSWSGLALDKAERGAADLPLR